MEDHGKVELRGEKTAKQGKKGEKGPTRIDGGNHILIKGDIKYGRGGRAGGKQSRCRDSLFTKPELGGNWGGGHVKKGVSAYQEWQLKTIEWSKET